MSLERCVWYNTSTDEQGKLTNPRWCGDCTGFKRECPYYTTENEFTDGKPKKEEIPYEAG